jgi:hypothetical protein
MGADVMSAKHRCNRGGSQKGPDHQINHLTPPNVGLSRPALLASASLIALAALGLPGAARADCNDHNQTISTTASGPISSTGGAITIKSSGTINGGPTGVSASSCSISTLANKGSIFGGAGGASQPGGVGVSNSQTIATLTNSGKISGGTGGSGFSLGVGGAGLSNGGTITSLSNSGKISGGGGGCPTPA